MKNNVLIIFILLLFVSVFGCNGLSTTLVTTTASSTTSTSTTAEVVTTTSINSSAVATSQTTSATISSTEVPTTTVTTIPFLEFNYDKLSGADLIIDISDIELTISLVETSLGVTLGETEVTVSGSEATFKQIYLDSIGLGEYEYVFSTSEGSINVTIIVTDTRMPHLESAASFPYVVDTDVVLTFIMYSGSLYGLSGNDITTDDYEFSNNQLTIDYDYIISKFIETPERTTLILGYTLTYPGGANVGYIYIQKP